eukprot:Skav207877  [mRNA]  locus=scaffold664:397187:404489:+ [translate_table: standard]
MPLNQFFVDADIDDDAGPEDAARKLARIQQTHKARVASLVSRTSEKCGKNDGHGNSSGDSSHDLAVREIQQMYLTPRLNHASVLQKAYGVSDTNPDKRISVNRSRCAWSLLCTLAQILETMLGTNGSGKQRVKHIINTIVPDDTNTRLKGPTKSDRSIVCTIMNQVQNCIVTYDGNESGMDENWDCLAIPCPATIVNTPDAVNLQAAYTSYLIASSHGIGQKWQSLGLPQSATSLEDAKWAIQIMCGDALEANSKAFHMERCCLANNNRDGAANNIAAIRIKCCNHQLGLIRKPCVLGIERFWSTLVRLAHLYESASFRRRLAAGIVTLLGTTGIFVVEPPQEMDSWKKRAAWLVAGFQASAKSTELLLRELLDFFNGDTSESVLVHWCIPNKVSGKLCCENDAASLNKGISLLTSFLTKGFAVPLLYRMKHYSPAAAFIRVGCCIHNILPRVLCMDKQSLTPADRPGSELSNVVDTLLGEKKPPGLGASKDLTNEDFEALVDKLLDEDKSFAAKNGARCQMVQKEISQPAFHQSSILIDAMVQRMERGTNFFLRRTKILYNLQYLSHAHPDYRQLMKESGDRFLKVIRGELAQDLVSEYMDYLNTGLSEAISMGFEGSQHQLNKIFQMVVTCMTDIWRRLAHEFMLPPFSLLKLADAPPTEFATTWNSLRKKFLQCQCCVDAEFTTQFFLKYAVDFCIPPTQSDITQIKEIQEVFMQICVWSPLTSDAVEILNGQTQWSLSRRGGQVLKQSKAGLETSILANAVKQYVWLQEEAGGKTLPNKADGKHPHRTREILETAAVKRARLERASKRKLRKLSGWNVFCRQQLEGSASSTDAYSAKVKEISQHWKALPSDQKQGFEVEAQHQETLRTKLAFTPLSIGNSAKTPTELEKRVGRKGCKRLSARRLKINESLYKKHDLWSLQTFTSCVLGEGALKSAQINMNLSDQDIETKLQATLHKFPEVLDADNVSDVHESPCHFFGCRGDPNMERVDQLVKSFSWGLQNNAVDAGSMVVFSVNDSQTTAFLGASMKKPMSHIFAMATLDDKEVSFAKNGGQPEFQSSHQLFWELLRVHSPNTHETIEISVEVWHCNAFVVQEDQNCVLKSNAERCLCTFTISSRKTTKNKPVVVTLPFSLDKYKRKQPRKNNVKKPKHTGKFKRSQPAKKDESIVVSSSSSTSSSVQDDIEINSTDDEMIEVEEEEPIPMSSVVKKEQITVGEIAKEIKQTDDLRSKKAHSVQQNMVAAEQAAAAPKKSSFFAEECGLDTGGIATTGRSNCYKCKNPIPMSTVRFSWHYSTKRPPSWVHCHCLYQLVKDTGLVKRAKERLAIIIEDGRLRPLVYQPVATEAEKILKLLNADDV